MRIGAIALFLCALGYAVLPAHAGLLSKLGKLGDEAGDAARKADGIGGTEIPSGALRAAKEPDASAVAMGVDDAGRLTLTDELGRTTPFSPDGDLDAALTAASPGGSGRVIVVTDLKTLSGAPAVAMALARRGALKLSYKTQIYPVRVTEKTLAAVTPQGIAVKIAGRRRTMADGTVQMIAAPDQRALDELIHAFDRPVNRGMVTVAMIGRPKKGPRRVGFGKQPAGKPGKTLVVPLDELLSGLPGYRGGTVMLGGKIEGGALSTPTGQVPLTELQRAAADADVNLILLDGWAVLGHAALAKSDSYGDLLSALAPRNGTRVAEVIRENGHRVRLTIRPESRDTGPSIAQRTEDVLDTAAEVTDVALHATHIARVVMMTNDKTEMEDRELRVIPGVPFFTQLMWAAGLVLGLYGWRMAWWLWSKIWSVLPVEGRIVHGLKVVTFVIFLMFTGIFWGIARYLWGWISWMFPKRKPAADAA